LEEDFAANPAHAGMAESGGGAAGAGEGHLLTRSQNSVMLISTTGNPHKHITCFSTPAWLSRRSVVTFTDYRGAGGRCGLCCFSAVSAAGS